jgi:hypothetical protein
MLICCPQDAANNRQDAGAPRYDSPCATNFQRCVALLVANGLFQRENNQVPAQTSDQNRRPVFVVPDLDRDNASGLKRFDLPLEIARTLIDL